MDSIKETEKHELVHITREIIRDYLYGTDYVNKQIKTAGPSPPINLSLPPQLRLGKSSIPLQPVGVFARAWLKEGTQMGPFCGDVMTCIEVLSNNKHYAHAWEVFDINGQVSHFVDGSTSPHSWVTWIQCARTYQEQNVELVQTGDTLLYRIIKNIFPGSELLVWYGRRHKLFMGIPTGGTEEEIDSSYKNFNVKPNTEKHRLIVTPLVVPSFPNVRKPGRYLCVLCRQGFNSRSNLRSHMRTHTQEKPFVCTFCGRRFSQSSTLRNHTRLHTGERPYKCHFCKSAYSQLAGLRAHQKSSAHKPREPLLNNAPTQQIDIMRNYLHVYQQ